MVVPRVTVCGVEQPLVNDQVDGLFKSGVVNVKQTLGGVKASGKVLTLNPLRSR